MWPITGGRTRRGGAGAGLYGRAGQGPDPLPSRPGPSPGRPGPSPRCPGPVCLAPRAGAPALAAPIAAPTAAPIAACLAAPVSAQSRALTAALSVALLLTGLLGPAAAEDPAPAGLDPAALEASLAAFGGLRPDTAPADAPFTRSAFLRAFEAVVFHLEAGPQTDPNILAFDPWLKRWQGRVAVTMTVIDPAFPDLSPAAQAHYAAAEAAALAVLADIAALTGLEIVLCPGTCPPPEGQAKGQTEGQSEDQSEDQPAPQPVALDLILPQAAPETLAYLSGFAPGTLEDLQRQMVASHFDSRTPGRMVCPSTVVYSGQPGGRIDVVAGATAFGADLTPRLLRMCIVEEMLNIFGPQGDWPHARPSILNDDGEFIAMTAMDRLILQVMYDPRLTPGMPRAAAMAEVARIAAALPKGTFAPEGACPMPPRLTFRPDPGQSYAYAVTGYAPWLRMAETWTPDPAGGLVLERRLVTPSGPAEAKGTVLPPLEVARVDRQGRQLDRREGLRYHADLRGFSTNPPASFHPFLPLLPQTDAAGRPVAGDYTYATGAGGDKGGGTGGGTGGGRIRISALSGQITLSPRGVICALSFRRDYLDAAGTRYAWTDTRVDPSDGIVLLQEAWTETGLTFTRRLIAP